MSEQEKNTEQGVHKRRTRYKGKYPRKFEEKYKELQPEKYQDMIAHVIQKGNTPAECTFRSWCRKFLTS